MNVPTLYSQATGQVLVPPPMPPMDEQNTFGQSPEINRLLTAAVVNRRFCRLLLTNPLAALALGYHGESFRLNPAEIQRVSAIHATSLHDFASQLLVKHEPTAHSKHTYESYSHSAMLALPSSSS